MIRYVCLLAVLLVGCAHGKTGQIDQPLEKDSFTKATPIFVEPVTTDNAAVMGDKAGKADVVAREKAKISDMFNTKIAEALRAKGYDAKAVLNAPQTAVVITGEVTKIDHGSGAARYFAGMGAGASNLYTNFKIEDRAHNKVLSKFEIIATSGAESGVGSYLDQHLNNGAKQLAEYVAKSQQ